MDISQENQFLVDCLTGAHAKLRKVFSGVRLDNRPMPEYLFLTTFVSIHSNISAWIMLYKLGLFVQAQVILRTILESYADLLNIKQTDAYADRLQFTVAKKQLQGLTNLVEPDGSNTSKLSAKIDHYRRVVDKHKVKETKVLSIKEKFEISNLSHYYISVYFHWSSFVHNDCTGTLFDCFETSCPVTSIHYYRDIDHNMNFAQMIIVTEILEKSANAMVDRIGDHDAAPYAMFCADCAAINSHLAAVAPTLRRGDSK